LGSRMSAFLPVLCMTHVRSGAHGQE
jgi:hypothetical protein